MIFSFWFALPTFISVVSATEATTGTENTSAGRLRKRSLSVLEISKFRLIDATNNRIVLDPLVGGSVYYLDSPPASIRLTVEAVVDGSVGSVRIDGRVENVAPYARCGDENGMKS